MYVCMSHKLNLFISPKKLTKRHDIHHFEAESELVKMKLSLKSGKMPFLSYLCLLHFWPLKLADFRKKLPRDPSKPPFFFKIVQDLDFTASY